MLAWFISISSFFLSSIDCRSSKTLDRLVSKTTYQHVIGWFQRAESVKLNWINDMENESEIQKTLVGKWIPFAFQGLYAGLSQKFSDMAC